MFKQTKTNVQTNKSNKTNKKIKRGESPFLLASYGGVLSEAEGEPWFPTESPFLLASYIKGGVLSEAEGEPWFPTESPFLLLRCLKRSGLSEAVPLGSLQKALFFQ